VLYRPGLLRALALLGLLSGAAGCSLELHEIALPRDGGADVDAEALEAADADDADVSPIDGAEADGGADVDVSAD
jgi:hypothetical protein